jgi:OOP family OmpA-OmpF porin
LRDQDRENKLFKEGCVMKESIGWSLVAALGCALVAGACGGEAPPPAATPATASAAPAAAAPDSDGDGIPDNVDKCPSAKEDGLPPDPKDGCPKQ